MLNKGVGEGWKKRANRVQRYTLVHIVFGQKGRNMMNVEEGEEQKSCRCRDTKRHVPRTLIWYVCDVRLIKQCSAESVSLATQLKTASNARSQLMLRRGGVCDGSGRSHGTVHSLIAGGDTTFVLQWIVLHTVQREHLCGVEHDVLRVHHPHALFTLIAQTLHQV